MSEVSFRVECATFFEGSGRWSVQGRAYSDVSVGDTLFISPNADRTFQVEEIESYGRSTFLLSRMMTGTLILSGGDKNSHFQTGACIYK